MASAGMVFPTPGGPLGCVSSRTRPDIPCVLLEEDAQAGPFARDEIVKFILIMSDEMCIAERMNDLLFGRETQLGQNVPVPGGVLNIGDCKTNCMWSVSHPHCIWSEPTHATACLPS